VAVRRTQKLQAGCGKRANLKMEEVRGNKTSQRSCMLMEGNYTTPGVRGECGKDKKTVREETDKRGNGVERGGPGNRKQRTLGEAKKET